MYLLYPITKCKWKTERILITLACANAILPMNRYFISDV